MWTFKIRQLSKNGNKIHITITTYAEGKEYAGRSMDFSFNECINLNTDEFVDKITEQARYITQQDFNEFIIKDKLKNTFNNIISIPGA